MGKIGCAISAAALLAGPPSAVALGTGIPATGLPSASMYSSTLLPEMQGVVSWKTLSQVEPVTQGEKIVPKFSSEILGLNGKVVRVQGFVLPLDLGGEQQHFLLAAVPPHCQFCLPAGPDAFVEVVAKKKLPYGFEPIILSGKFAVLKDDPSGMFYRLTEAEPLGMVTR